MENCKNSSGEDLVAGALLVGIPALIHNVAKNEQHQRELTQTYSQGYWQGQTDLNPVLTANETAITKLTVELAVERVSHNIDKQKIAQLEQAVSDLSATVKALQLQMTAKIFPRDDDGGQLN